MKTCSDCIYFLGGGDFGTCCSQSYNLCYAYSEICDKFDKRYGKTHYNCSVVKKCEKLGIGHPIRTSFECDGYIKSDMDDEPIENCKKCEWFTGCKEEN
jgi:hypothetical protein